MRSTKLSQGTPATRRGLCSLRKIVQTWNHVLVQNALHENSLAIFAKEDNVACNLHASQSGVIFVNEPAESRSTPEQLADVSKLAYILHRLF